MSQPKAQRERLGDMLVAAGLVTPVQLQEALRVQQSAGNRLGKVLVTLGHVSEVQLAQTLSNQLSIPWVSLERVEFSRELLARVPAGLADRHTLMPVYVRSVRGQGDTLYVAMEDPTDEIALQALSAAARLPVKPMIAAPSDIRRAIDRHYFAESPGGETPQSGTGLQEALQRAAENLQEPVAMGRADATRTPRQPPPRPAGKARPEKAASLVPIEEYESPSQPPGGHGRTLTFLDGTRISVPPSGATRLNQDVSEVRHVIRAIRAINADAGIDDVPSWHDVLQAVLDAAGARGVRLTRKDVAEAWLAVRERASRTRR